MSEAEDDVQEPAKWANGLQVGDYMAIIANNFSDNNNPFHGIPAKIVGISYPFVLVNNVGTPLGLDMRRFTLVKINDQYGQAFEKMAAKMMGENAVVTGQADIDEDDDFDPHTCPRCHVQMREALSPNGPGRLVCPNCGLDTGAGGGQ